MTPITAKLRWSFVRGRPHTHQYTLHVADLTAPWSDRSALENLPMGRDIPEAQRNVAELNVRRRLLGLPEIRLIGDTS